MKKMVVKIGLWAVTFTFFCLFLISAVSSIIMPFVADFIGVHQGYESFKIATRISIFIGLAGVSGLFYFAAKGNVFAVVGSSMLISALIFVVGLNVISGLVLLFIWFPVVVFLANVCKI